MAIWRPLAEGGDADAAFNLGQAYRLGRGVPTNLAIAKSWFERAARQNHVDAQTTLGLLLFQNGDQAEGLKWLKAAAEQGEARALLVYGTALFNGDGVTQDPVLGYAYRQPRRGARPRAGQGHVGPARQADAARPAQEGRRDRQDQGENRAPARPQSGETEQAGAGRATKPEPAPAPKPASADRKACARARRGADRAAAPGASSSAPSRSAARPKRSTASSPASHALAGRRAFYIPVGAITRLQVGPFESKAAADAACKALGTACFPCRRNSLTPEPVAAAARPAPTTRHRGRDI